MSNEFSRRRFVAAGWGAAVLGTPGIARAAGPCGSHSRLCDLLAEAGRDGSNTHAVLVQRGTETLAEAYYTGQDRPQGSWFARQVAFGPEVQHDLRSVSKSVVGLLVGIAQSQGRIGELSRPVFDFFPEHADLLTQERRGLTVRHLLDMATGWDWDENTRSYANPLNSETRLNAADDKLRHMLELPLVAAPGTRWEYCGGATFVLAEMLERVSGKPLAALAQEWLLGPLGITRLEWRSGRDGKALSYSGLRLTPRDLARIGRLLLTEGRIADRQVLPSAWVKETFTARYEGWDRYRYGAHWWHGRLAQGPGSNIYWAAAWGNGGQRLFVVPSLDAVIVMTAGRYNEPGQSRPSILLLRQILEVLRS